jgi:ATP phosphoribosyltransferase regulatory subunit
MPAFPHFDTPSIDALNLQADAILKCFAARGYARQEPSVLQPADIFLDRSGEEIRRRTFTLTDPSGRELCLRPDLTIPICKMTVDSHATFPQRISYNGLVFRHQPNEPQRGGRRGARGRGAGRDRFRQRRRDHGQRGDRGRRRLDFSVRRGRFGPGGH